MTTTRRLLILAALLLPSVAHAQAPALHIRGSFRHDHRRRHRPGRPTGVDGPTRVRGAKPERGQPVGVRDGNRGRRAAVDPDPGRSAVSLHEPGVRPGVFDHRRDHGAGVRGASVVKLGRRSLLLAGAAFPTAAYGQCVINAPAVDACLGGVRINGPSLPPGVTLDLNFMNPGTLDPRITFTRASTAAYIDASGFIQMAAVNAPRWDYDPVTHGLRGVLIEEQRTNVLLNGAVILVMPYGPKAAVLRL